MHDMLSRSLAAAGVLALLTLSACATRPPASDPAAVADFEQTNDPLEPANRFTYNVSTKVDAYTLKPVAQGYVAVVPKPVRSGLHNLLDNLNNTVVFANDVVQAKPTRAGTTFMRFLINSTFGVAGLFDVATPWGYAGHDNDFGITLALWGVPEGPYLFLPLLGPNPPRDLTGYGVDIAADPFTWVPSGHGLKTLNWALVGLGAIDERSLVLNDLDRVQAGALDPYATIRSLYRQHRQSEIDAARAAH